MQDMASFGALQVDSAPPPAAPAVSARKPREVGEISTMATLRERYAPRISRMIFAMLGPDSEREDLIHDILITVFRRIETLRDPGAMDGWVQQVARNALRHTLRQRAKRRTEPLELEHDTLIVDHDVESRELASRAMALLRKLPERERKLLERLWFTPVSLDEMTKEGGVSRATLRRRLNKARVRFELLVRRDPALAEKFHVLESARDF
jgi:RNA polymerase sigma-70 factor (ECF subfamily)